MLPNQPEKLEDMRKRLPAALSCVYNAEDIERGVGQRPGEKRQHVFDFEDGIRCIASLDRQPDGHIYLHMSFSTIDWHGQSLPAFFARVEQIPVDFWPDTILLAVQQFMTPRAVHVIYDPPHDWKRFYEVCAGTPKTASSAG
jgi:hypothetical protein